jgi:DNA-binding MarR family transcriptional regulator
MGSVTSIMSDLCKKYDVKQSTVERLLEAEESKRDLRRRRGLPDLLRRIIEDEVESKEAQGAAPKS